MKKIIMIAVLFSLSISFTAQSSELDPAFESSICTKLTELHDGHLQAASNPYYNQIVLRQYNGPYVRFSPEAWTDTSSKCSILEEGYSDAKFTLSIKLDRKTNYLYWNTDSTLTCLISALDYEWECLYNNTRNESRTHFVHGSNQWYQDYTNSSYYQKAVLDTAKIVTSSWY